MRERLFPNGEKFFARFAQIAESRAVLELTPAIKEREEVVANELETVTVKHS